MYGPSDVSLVRLATSLIPSNAGGIRRFLNKSIHYQKRRGSTHPDPQCAPGVLPSLPNEGC